MKLTNEICISFLRGSGWLYNHDKEITISERNKSIDDFGSKLEKDVLFTLDRIRAYERNKAIDDFVRFANTMPTVESEDGAIRPMWLEEIAEQLKVGGENEQRI